MWLAATRSSISAARSGGACARTGFDDASSSAATSGRAACRRPRSMSEPLHHLGRVLDRGRLREAVADQLAPLGEIGGAAEIDGVVLDRVPLHEQAIAARMLGRALQLHAGAALGAPEQRRGLLHAALELGFHAG